MRHRHHGQRHREHRQSAIAAFTACDNCASLIGNPEPSEDGIHMTIMHAEHVPEFEALGWITTPGEEVPDCCCPHYHQANWQGGHGPDCCGADDA